MNPEEFCPKCKTVHPAGQLCAEAEDAAGGTPEPFTRKVLDLDLPSPDCSANIFCRFHKGRPLRVVYGRGILVVICSKCSGLVASFKIAEE